MKNFKKKIAMLSAIAMAGTMLVGCGNTTGSSDDTTTTASEANGGGESQASQTEAPPAADVADEDDVLTILSWESNSDVQRQKEFFCKKNGIDESKVNIVACGAGGEAARDGIQQYMQGSEDADLFTMDADWTPLYTNDDSLTVAYSEIGITAEDFPDAYPYTIAYGTSEAGIFKAATFQCTPGGFVYRSDLAKEYLGVESPDQMQEKVKDWATFEATAAELYTASGEKTSICATTGGLWQVYQCFRTQPWVKDGKFQMDTAEDFYDLVKKYVDNKYCAKVPQWDAAWYAAVQDGTALGDFVPTWGLTVGTDSILDNFSGGASTNDKLAICEGPAAWSWGGTYYGVSTRCNTKATAKLWIETFCNNLETMEEYAKETGDFVNSKTVMSKVASEGSSNPLLGGQDHISVLMKGADKVDYTGKVSRYDSQCKQVFNKSVEKLLNGEVADKAAAVDDCKANIAATLPDVVVE